MYFWKGITGILYGGKKGIIGVIWNGYPQEVTALI